MVKKADYGQLIKSFILIKGSSSLLFKELVSEIELLNGQISHAFPPEVVIALIPSAMIEIIRGKKGVAFLTTELIDKPHPSLSGKEYHEIINVWNSQIAGGGEYETSPESSADLSWDTPGYLPPDPPLYIRKMMEKWENDTENT